MLQIREDVASASGLFRHPGVPVRQFPVAVLVLAQANVSELAGGNLRRVKLVALRDTEGGARIRDDREDRLVEPARVAELEGVAQARVEDVEKVCQPLVIAFEVGRQLKEDRPELVFEQLATIDEVAGQLVHVLQPALVGDALIGLDGESETVRCAVAPPFQQACGGEAVEGVVDLDCGESLGVELEELGLRQRFRIE